MNRVQQESFNILIGEADARNAARLFRALILLGHRPALAMSSRQLVKMIGAQIFRHAIVAAELTIEGDPVLARLSRLPCMERLIALGQAGNVDMESRARLAGADMFLPRPVAIESLAKALQIRVPFGRMQPQGL